jgi:hypothetical protein
MVYYWQPAYVKMMKLLLERDDSKNIDFHSLVRSIIGIGTLPPVIHLLDRLGHLPGDR